MVEDSTNKADQDGADANLDEFKPKSEAEIRQDIINDFQFDEELESERIDKLVKERQVAEAKFSTVLKQKQNRKKEAEDAIKKRDEIIAKAKAVGIDPETGQPVKKDLTPDEFDKRLEEKVNSKFFEKELNNLGFSDTLTKEIKDYCEFKKCSLQEALKSPLVKSLASEEEKEVLNNEASLTGGRVNKSSFRTKINKPSMSDFDMKNKEGRESYMEANDKYIEGLKAG